MLTKRDNLYFLVIAIAAAGALFLIGNAYYKTIAASTFFSPVLLKQEQEVAEETIKLIFAGDVMLDRGVKASVYEHGEGEFSFLFEKSSEFLNEADILFGNLESVVSDKGEKIGSKYSFRAPPEAVSGLTEAGFNIVSVANNHVFDYGRVAMEDSFVRLGEAGIKITGGGFSYNEACFPTMMEVKGVRVAFLAYTDLAIDHWLAGENSSGICFLSEKNLDNGIRKAEGSDLTVISLHFGSEYQDQPTVQQKYWGRYAVDKGADLVIGHHPHVIQPVENYNQGFIAYSLGNFIFDQNFSEETMEGLLVEVEASKQGVREIRLHKAHLNDYFQPETTGIPE